MSSSSASGILYDDADADVDVVDVVIAGAGVAGLACALRILQRQPDTKLAILEKRRNESELCADVGGGYGVTEKVVSIFDRLGLADDARKKFGVLGDVRFIDPIVKKRAGIVRVLNLHGGVTATRGAMQELLTDALRERTQQSNGNGTSIIRYDERVVDVKQDKDGVTVKSHRGTVVRAKCLIGADGIWSKVRELCFKNNSNNNVNNNYPVTAKEEHEEGQQHKRSRRSGGGASSVLRRLTPPFLRRKKSKGEEHPSSSSSLVRSPRFQATPFNNAFESKAFRAANGKGAICWWGKANIDVSNLDSNARTDGFVSTYHTLRNGVSMFATSMSNPSRVIWAAFTSAETPSGHMHAATTTTTTTGDHDVEMEEEANVKEQVIAVMKRAKWLPSSFAVQLVDRTAAQDITRHPIFDLPPSHDRSDTSRSRVALIGDAAHAMVPFLGAGACSAIGDGFSVANLLSDPDLSVEEALATYSERRCDGNARNARRSRELMGYTLCGSRLLDSIFASCRLHAPLGLLQHELTIADRHNEFVG